ncbi:MAG: FAD binding domain-containing protein [Bacteroidetes bacterium]|nr:FAD binding domain-containing protein [Bacteroidota bacterium]
MNTRISFLLNDNLISEELNPAAVLLDYLRSAGLTGTKEGCREGDCGACTVISGQIRNNTIVYRTVNSCLIPLMNVNGHHIVTIEGLNQKKNNLTPVQHYFINEGASQCGFCTPGFIVSATGFLLSGKDNSYDNIIDAIDGNICRCTGHNSIIRAVNDLAAEFSELPEDFHERIEYLIRRNVLPEFFRNIEEKLPHIKTMSGQKNGNETPKYFVGGGTDLFVQKPAEMLSSELTFLRSSDNLNEIFERDGFCFVGSGATVTDILNSPLIKDYFPGINEFSELFGSTPIRNSATLGGNINNASPIGDMTAFFLALDPEVILSGGTEERSVRLKNFFISYKKTVRKQNEFLKYLKFRIPGGEYFFNFEKVSKRTYLDIASVNSAVLLKLDNNFISDIHISAGGVFEIPKYLSAASEFLLGKNIDPEILRQAVEIADTEISPISDARGSERYKRLLLSRLIYAHFIKLFPNLIDIKETV